MAAYPHTIRVALMEPLALMREALTVLLLDLDAAIKVVAAGSDAETLANCRAGNVDVLVMSIDQGDDIHEAALSELVSEQSHPCRVLVLTSHADHAFGARLIELGARGVVLKHETGPVLSKAIRTVHMGDLWIARALVTSVVTHLTRTHVGCVDRDAANVESLTAREREIVALVADGLTNADIGQRLFISPLTVRNHLTSILSKLDVSNRFQLAVYAFRRGLVLCPATAEMRHMSATMTERPMRRQDGMRVARHKDR